VELVRQWHTTWHASKPGSNCLKLTPTSDVLSPSIQQAMTVEQLLPKVESTTPQGKLTLVNARIVGSVPVPNRGGSGSPKGADTHELEQVSLTFGQIDVSTSGGAVNTSVDWSQYPP